jgi:hypothetical protein
MTDRKSRRVVIINNINSDTIDQAIFILKHDTNKRISKQLDTSIAAEAQAIIDSYIRQVDRIKGTHTASAAKTKKAKASHTLLPLLITMGLVCVGLSFLLLYYTG